MTSLNRTTLAIGLGLLTALVACSGSASPGGDTSDSEVIVAPTGQLCEGNPPPNARCAAACPYGYKGASGTFTCECCTAPAADAGNGEVCGGPPPNARCMACPGGGNSYLQVDGKPTCGCCSVADAGADSAVDGGAVTCGGPPPNARCMACPDGSYKHIDGQPTCQCCNS